MSGFLVNGVAVCAPDLTVRNFVDDGVHRFVSMALIRTGRAALLCRRVRGAKKEQAS